MYFSSKFFKTLRGWDGKSRFEALFFQVDKSMVKISIKKCYQSHFKLTFPFKILEPSYEISISTYDMKKKKKKNALVVLSVFLPMDVTTDMKKELQDITMSIWMGEL